MAEKKNNLEKYNYPKADAIVIDSYHISSSYISSLKKNYFLRILISDKTPKNCDCEIVINHNLYAKNLNYSKFKHSKILKGPKFNLIDKKFLPKSEYLSLSEKCNVFIAPRKKEGIGITIVEAISKGMFVVGYNDSTMNEYVSDKKLGFIFDEKTTEKINTKDIIENYGHRKKYAEFSYNKWI